jgi:hypothetical protein
MLLLRPVLSGLIRLEDQIPHAVLSFGVAPFRRVFAADFTSWVERFELSVDAKAWMPFWESKFTKVK